MNLFGLFQQNRSAIDRQRATNERLQQYARYLRAYQGYSVRGILNTNIVRDWKKVKFNFIQPVVNLSAGWFAAKPVDWKIANDPEATDEAYAIWNRSGSDACLLENALLCGIYGEIVGIATQDAQNRARIEFIDPSICTPQFDGADYSQLRSLEIAYESLNDQGETQIHREMWDPRGMETYEDDKLVDRRPYDVLPACWIRNSAVKGLPFGLSDVEPILELVEEYDHLCSKQTRIVDYYASPNIIFEGVQKNVVLTEKSVATVYYLPTGSKAYFLEWSGSGPDVEAQLTRCRNAIAEISQVPAVAFGQADSGITSISGIGLKILYGPLISKTHRKQACWSTPLQYLMWLCLRASGYKALPIEDVGITFPDATPVDGTEATAQLSAKIAARILSRRTAMNEIGIEHPEDELKKIVIEEKILQLSTPAPALQQDANTSAKAGARGIFAAEVPAGVGANGGPGAAPTVGDTTSTNDDDIAHLIERFDALIALENESLTENDPPESE